MAPNVLRLQEQTVQTRHLWQPGTSPATRSEQRMSRQKPVSSHRPLLESERNAFTEIRHQMVQDQLRARGIENERVLRAMAEVPREEFVTTPLRDVAYADGALPIACGQTISQPFTVAFMCEAAQISAADKVLEIGTGSGYGAAVLSRLCREVHTVEHIEQLGKHAARRLQQLGYVNAHVHEANGTLGLQKEAPFDAIVVTAGAAETPKPLLDQLRDGGRIIIPLGNVPTCQNLYRITRRSDDVQIENLGGFAFVPLIGEHGWRS
jgi:protein-L-isoaspartate(D-aspartate) O-methyltransferase